MDAVMHNAPLGIPLHRHAGCQSEAPARGNRGGGEDEWGERRLPGGLHPVLSEGAMPIPPESDYGFDWIRQGMVQQRLLLEDNLRDQKMKPNQNWSGELQCAKWNDEPNPDTLSVFLSG